MNRVQLVKTLDLIRPALSDNNLVPVFTCFVFQGKTVTAYNDSLGMIVQLSEPLADEPFATSGAPLLGLLQHSHAEAVTFQVSDESVTVKTGKSTINLPYFKEEEFLFEEPKETWAGNLNLSGNLLDGIQICLSTSSKDQTQPAIMGVCFNFDLKGMTLFSCDGDAITRYSIPIQGKGKGSYTVPNVFCEALLKVSRETESQGGKLEVNQNWAKATLKNGTIIYGRMIVNEAPLDHSKLLEGSMKEKQPFVGLPLGLNEALSRARVLADPESAKTVMTVQGNKLRLVTETPMGALRDELSIKGHGDVEAAVHASLVQRSLEVCDQISIRSGVTAYKQDDTVLQVVGNIGA